jgi:hypothetical protein
MWENRNIWLSHRTFGTLNIRPVPDNRVCLMLTDFCMNVAFLEVTRRRLFAVLVREVCRYRQVWNTGRTKLTEESQSTRRKTCHGATLSTTNLTWTGLGSKCVICEALSLGNNRSSSNLAENTLNLHYEKEKVTAVWGGDRCLL